LILMVKSPPFAGDIPSLSSAALAPLSPWRPWSSTARTSHRRGGDYALGWFFGISRVYWGYFWGFIRLHSHFFKDQDLLRWWGFKGISWGYVVP
jgi:hypothetical protein